MSSISSISSAGVNLADFSASQQSLFTKADSDGDGAISQEEFSTLLDNSPRLAKDLASLVSTTDDTSSETDSSDIFASLDEDGDGLLTEDQFETALTDARQAAQAGAMAGGMPPPPPPSDDSEDEEDFSTTLESVFSSGDTDSDGYITADDLETMASDNPGLTADLAALTESEDGTVDFDAAFSALDTDGDGQVSQSEFVSSVQTAHEANAPDFESLLSSSSSTDSSSSSSTVGNAEIESLLREMFARNAQNGYNQNGAFLDSGGTPGILNTSA